MYYFFLQVLIAVITDDLAWGMLPFHQKLPSIFYFLLFFLEIFIIQAYYNLTSSNMTQQFTELE
jgi:hypothetical protein